MNKMKIIVVDDNDEIVNIMCEMLEMHYDVKGFTCPLEVLDACGEYTPDVLITDYDMPLMDGCELIRTLRNNGIAENSIMITGSVGDIDEIPKGVQIFHKPLPWKKLMQVLLILEEKLLHKK